MELAVGMLWAIVAFQSTGGSFEQFLFSANLYGAVAIILLKFMLLWLLVALAMLDAEHLWLPNWLTLTGIALGLVYALVGMISAERFFLIKRPPLSGALYWLAGVFVPAALILIIRWTYWLIRHREGIGLGDAKLMAMLGAWLGLSGALLSFGIGVLLGALVAIIALALPAARRESETWLASKLPLGTFLCIGGIISTLWGQPIIDAYKRWAGF